MVHAALPANKSNGQKGAVAVDNTLYVALSHQMAMQRQMDIIANNIANASTTAFRNESVLFEEYVVNTDPSSDQMGNQIAFVQDRGVVRNLAEGEFTQTGNELDAAISGKGYFQVQDPKGNTLYTRNGHFHVDGTGQIVTTKGYPVLDAFGKPLTVNLNDSTINIATDGTITAASGRRGRLGIVTFPNEQAMNAVGDSMFKTDQKPTPTQNVKILSGMLEGSNVEPVIELTKMVDVLRSYESTAKLLQTYEDLQRESIQQVGKVQ
jgi:flagellar basal-body rod protein FlgF